MKKRTIQSTFLIVLISVITVITTVVCHVSIVEVNALVKQNAETILDTTCEMEAAMINKSLSSMRKSVTVMANYIDEQISDTEDLINPEIKNNLINDAEEMFTNIANATEGAVAYYFRLSPEISNSKEGFFFTKPGENTGFIRYETTDLALYDKDDREKVGWYWEPVEAGGPLWMMPYFNKNNDIYMISYVIPLYKDGTLLGVVGIDFDYAVLTKTIDNIKVYDNGFAYLRRDDKIVHHKDLEMGAEVPDNSAHFKESSVRLENGMTLVITAGYDDIYKIKYDILKRTIFTITLFGLLSILLIVIIIRKLVQPIKKLTKQTNKIAEGNYDIDVENSFFAEIETLGDNFKLMAKKVHEHDMQQRLLAYRDSLTGLKNTNSYKSWVGEFEQEPKSSDEGYGIVVLDINCLKETNDNFGHDTGNKLIFSVAQIISGVFKRCPVFRIGGDEFVVVLKDRDFNNYPSLLEELDERCKNEFIEADGEKISISVAHGVAVHDGESDESFTAVFNRADDAMYENKRATKKGDKA